MIDDRITVRFKNKKKILEICKRNKITPSYFFQFISDDWIAFLEQEPTFFKDGVTQKVEDIKNKAKW